MTILIDDPTMPRIKLYLLKGQPRSLVDQGGRQRIVHPERILGLLCVAPDTIRIRECLVDTGAPLSIFPERIWRDFEENIVWLTLRDNAAVAWLDNVQGLTGGSMPARLGTIEIKWIDCNGSQSRPTKIIAKFASDPETLDSRLPRILIGLGGNVWDRRRLTVNHDSAEAYIDEY